MACSSANPDEEDYNLLCSICRDKFEDPVIIDCYHSFCRKCIEDVILIGGHHDRFKCPICKRKIKVPSDGASGFQNSFYVEQMMNMMSSLQSPYPKCPEHGLEELRFYCDTCELPYCRDCKVLEHEGHSARYISKVAEEMKGKLIEKLDEVNKDLHKLESERDEWEQDKERLDNLKEKQRNELKTQTKKMKRALDKNTRKLDKEICKYFEVHETELEMEDTTLENKYAQLQKKKKST